MTVFLTTCRNEARILPAFLAEFSAMVQAAGISGQVRLYVVDDLFTGATVSILEDFGRSSASVELRVIRAPTNLGNQGALFFGLRQIEVDAGDVLVTFDCDGE